ncbi:MAG: dimethyl sulfoxide reductase anchor subunit [Acidobacteria bacterium]|nr:dimethyl sulfoxide reductase anchor subunit [Acidobacteriota bacterium]
MSLVKRAARGAADDWPLVVFTSMAIIGAGLVLTPIAALAGGSGAAAAVRLAGAGAALIAAALAVSLAHLGRPLRAARAAANLRQSRLSAEVLFALATLAAALISFAWPALLPGASMVAGLLAGELLVSLGLVYALPNQPAWRGPAAASPMTMALPLAVLALAARGGEPFGPWRPVVAVLLAADLGLFAWRALRLFSIPSWCEPAYSRRFRHRAVLLALRFTLVTLMPLFFALVARPLAATVALAFGILADRAGFYALAVRQTPEAEIAAAEAAIAP